MTDVQGASLRVDGSSEKPAPSRRDVNRTALRAGTFVIVGYGFSQAIRLAGNIVLTRLLIPEMFAIMTLAQVVYLGLGFFSDIGLGPAIIRSTRAYDAEFLNTAWTLGIIRSLALWVLTIAVAYPASLFYKEHQLVYVIPAIGFNAVLSGFNSTALTTLQKELRQGQLTLIDLVVQVVSLACSLVAALLYRSIWALVAGGLVGSVLKLVWSHFLPSPVRNRLAIDRKAAGELMSFGKWVLFSTAMMFLGTQADKLLLGRLFPLAFFGVYGIAVALAELPKEIVNRLGDKVLYPLFSQFARDSREELRRNIARRRYLLLLPLAALIGLLAGFGDYPVRLLYDERYRQAAWILPMLAIGMWPLVLYITVDRSLYAIGKPVYSAVGNLAKFCYMVVAIPLLYHVAGVMGAVIAVVLNDLPIYFVINWGLRKEKLSLLGQDAIATLVLAGVVGLGIALRILLGLGLPGQSVFVLP